MKLFKTYTLTLFLLLFHISQANFNYCDNGNFDVNGEDIDQICNGGYLSTNINALNSFTGSYQNIQNGYFGSSYNLGLKEEIQYNYYIGFLGSHFKGRELFNMYNMNPVGYFGDYIGKTLIFDENTSKYFSPGEQIVFGTSSQQNSQSSKQKITCNPPQNIENESIKMKHGDYSDYIELSWDKTGDKTKIIQISPRQKIYDVQEGNTLIVTDIIQTKKYSYFIVPYNDCTTGLYSNLLSLKYEKKINDIQFKIKEDEIYLTNVKDIISPKIYCTYNGLNFINNFLDSNYSYKIPIDYLLKPFSCWGEYFDIDGKVQKIPMFINEVLDNQYLTNRETILLIAGENDVDLYFNDKLYFLYNDISLEENLDYYSLSLLLINVIGETFINDKKLALDTLKDLTIVKSDTNGLSNVNYYDFINIVSTLNKQLGFKEDIVNSFKKIFIISAEKAFTDIQKTYYINEGINSLEYEEKEIILDCYTYNNCSDKDLFKKFDTNLYNTMYANEYKNLGIDFSIQNINYHDYIEIIYKIFSKEGFYKGNYKYGEFEKFINILLESVFYNQNVGEQNVDYFGYYRLNVSLLDSGLHKKLNKLIIFLENINKIYYELNDNSKLLNLIRAYLYK